MEEMTQERETRILERAIKFYGPETQIIVAIEECSELQKALTKWLRYERERPSVSIQSQMLKRNIMEEMADVSIMLKQLALIFDPADVEEARKLRRLEARTTPHSLTVVIPRKGEGTVKSNV